MTTRWSWPRTAPEAVAAFTANRPSVTLLDLGLPPRPNEPEEGLATLSSLLALDPLAKVIIVSGQGDKQNALRAVGAGAYDFLCKPVDMDELRLVLQRCVYVAELEQEYRAHAAEPAGRGLRGHAGRQPADAGRLHLHSQGGADHRAGLDSRRKRHRQGNGGAGAPPPQPAQERPVHRHQLQRHPGEPARERALRPREGLLHRRAHAAQGAHRIGRRRHALPRRDRRAAGAGAGEAAALSAGEALSAGRRPAGDSERRARDCRDES